MGRIFPGILAGLLLTGWAYAENLKQERKESMSETSKTYILNPVGQVRRQGDLAVLEIEPKFAPALDGIQGFSHVWVFYWFHDNDLPEERATLKVHPRRDPANPLTGVFACRAPARPNLIGLCACRLVKLEGNRLTVEGLDAKDGSPIIDIKPYIPEGDAVPGATTPAWVKRPRPSQ